MASSAASRPLPAARRAILAESVRDRVLDALKDAPRGTAVLLSGGVDSQAVFRALLALEREPVGLSFRVAGREPRDWRIARETCAEVGAEFWDVVMPADLDDLLRYVRWAVEHLGLRRKTAIECFWPRKLAIDYATAKRAPALATGDGGDGYHGLSKRAMIHYRDSVADMDNFRRAYFARDNWSQTRSIREYAAEFGLEVYMPLDGLLDLFLGLSWGQVNLPQQKTLLRSAFVIPDSVPKHMILQGGDSGIADLFAELAAREGATSPIALYNRIAREAEAPSLF